jgi:hypothetical protein
MARWPAVMARLLGFLGGELWRKAIHTQATAVPDQEPRRDDVGLKVAKPQISAK